MIASRVILRQVPIAAVSIVLAALLWVAVTNEENPTLRRELPFQVQVQAVNVPRLYVMSGTNPEKVDISLVGPRDRISSVRPGDLSVRVDLTAAVTPGSGIREPLRFRAPAEVTVRQRGVQAEVVPSSVEVTLEPEVRRVVPVRANPIDALPLGFELIEAPSIQPATATIVGAKQNVDLVDAAIADIKLAGLTVNIDKRLSLDPRDTAGHAIGHVTIDPSDATVALRVRQVLFTRQMLVDPRVRGRPAPGYAIGSASAEPPSANVVGSLNALNQLSTIPTQDVDVEGATSEVVRTVSLALPTGVSGTDARNSVVVCVPIQSLSGPGSLGVVPRVVGLGAGLGSTLQTPTVVLNFSGPLPVLLRLSAADVIVTVDASGLGPGAYRLEPKVGLPPGVQLEGLVPDRVSLTVGASGAR